MTADLAGFLLTQLDADETVARAATQGPWFREYGDVVTTGDDPRDVAEGCDEPRAERISRRAPHRDLRDAQGIADADHIALHDPAFELDRIAALRTVVELHKVRGRNILGQPVCASCSPLTPAPCPTLLALAQPYRGRPGWRDEWGTG